MSAFPCPPFTQEGQNGLFQAFTALEAKVDRMPGDIQRELANGIHTAIYGEGSPVRRDLDHLDERIKSLPTEDRVQVMIDEAISPVSDLKASMAAIDANIKNMMDRIVSFENNITDSVRRVEAGINARPTVDQSRLVTNECLKEWGDNVLPGKISLALTEHEHKSFGRSHTKWLTVFGAIALFISAIGGVFGGLSYFKKPVAPAVTSTDSRLSTPPTATSDSPAP